MPECSEYEFQMPAPYTIYSLSSGTMEPVFMNLGILEAIVNSHS
jgi:hypothetical protein